MPQVQLNDFRMNYLEQGSGSEVFVFVHGFISSTRWWLPALKELPQRVHAYTLDLRACGESEQIDTGHTLAQYAEDLHQFVEQVGLQRFTLVGHSMGGGVSMQYALHHQDRLKALVLVDPMAPFGTRLDADITAWINAQQGSAEGLRPLVVGAFATPPAGDYLEHLIADAARWNRAIYLGTMDDMARFNVSARLAEIKVPTLVTWGDKDTVVPFAGVAEVFTSVPGCAIEVWHGVGHSGPIEIPTRFVELLTRFVGEVNAAPQQA